MICSRNVNFRKKRPAQYGQVEKIFLVSNYKKVTIYAVFSIICNYSSSVVSASTSSVAASSVLALPDVS